MKTIRQCPGIILSLLLTSSLTIPSLSKPTRKYHRRKPFQNLRHSTSHGSSSSDDDNNVSIRNCTCHFITQPLDHFSSFSPTFQQRYCIYDKYSSNSSSSSQPSPIFFYTGNESPLEQYINHTGLIWQLAPHHAATIIFAEHRYEGLSLPPPSSSLSPSTCRSYATSAQALADYAALLSHLDPRNEKPPVIAFGGSYGGMLSSWMRMKYPSSVAGAIASSAPIWGLSQTYPPLDGAWRAVSRALIEGRGGGGGGCFDNLLAGWVLVDYFGRSGGEGRSVLAEVFDLCGELRDEKDVEAFLEGLQSVWFDMAEGDYPFASSYIVSAVGPGVYELPPWVMSEACDRVDGDYGVSIEGNKSDVRFAVTSSLLDLVVDWDVVTPARDYNDDDLLQSQDVLQLFSAIKDAVSLWYNVTGVETCFDIFNTETLENQHVDWGSTKSPDTFSRRNLQNDECQTQIASEGCWDSLCCNESLNLVNYLVRGIGNDFFWPPNVERNFSRTEVIYEMSQDEEEYCSSLFSTPVTNDPLSQYLDDYYGGLRIGMHSNIIFSNGLHDPWSSAGVYPSGIVPDGGEPMISNITEDGSVVSLVLEKGGHHLDLMFANENDPPEVTLARELEDSFIGKWIEEWKMQKCVGSVCTTRTGSNESR